MGAEIETFRVEQFKTGIQHLAQQEISIIEPLVEVDNDLHGKITFHNQVAATSVRKKPGRNADTPIIPVPHRRRAIVTDTYDTGDTVDRKDLLTVLDDPRNSYVESFGMAMGRKIDNVIILASDASSRTGEKGDVLVALPASQILDLASFAGSITLAKTLTVKRIFDTNQEEKMDRNALMTALQYEDMLNISEVKDGDFNVVKALVQGEVDTWLGMKWGSSEELVENAAGTARKCLFFQKKSIKFGREMSPFSRITEREDKSYSWQLYYAEDFGATRMDETGVIIMDCDES